MNKCIAKKQYSSYWTLLVIMLMLALPGYSHAWTLSTRVTTTGGAIQVGSSPLQTSANGTVFKTYTTTSRTIPVALLPDTGYDVSSLTVNGTALASPYPSTVAMGLPSYPTKTSQTLSVGFAKKLIPITTALETPTGSVSPSGTYTPQYGSSTSVTFTPYSGYSVWKIFGLPSGAALTSASTGSVVTLPYAGAVRVSFTVPSTPVTLSGAFVPLLANAGAPKTILPGGRAVLQGSVKTYDGSLPVDATYAWRVKSGPDLLAPIASPNDSVTSFTATITGTYTLELQVTDSLNATSTVTTYVVVTDSFAAAGRDQCQTCHTSSGFTATTFNAWSSSKHQVHGVVCAYCHVGTDTGNHPSLLHANTVDKNTYLFNPIVNPSLGNSSFCLSGTCHNPGASHKTDGMVCSTCHTGGTHNTDATYADSLNVCSTCHAPSSNCFVSYTTDQCVTCHATVHGPKLLDHFAFATIDTQTEDTPFDVTIIAQDHSNNTVVGFTGRVELTISDGSWDPPIPSGNFVNGVGTVTVTAPNPGTGLTIKAKRIGGSETGISNPFDVTARTSGHIFEWLEPISLGKSWHGSTIPIKFKLKDSNGAVIPDAVVCLEVYPVSGETMADDPAQILSNADSGTCFRYSNGIYIYNLDTDASNLNVGTYHVHAVFADGTTHMIPLTLK